MELIFRRLLRMSVSLKKLSFSQVKCVSISSSTHFYKDDIRQHKLNSLKDDAMFKTIQDINPENLLRYIDLNKHQIECKHIMLALKSLQNFYKNKFDFSDSSCDKIDFTKLCSSLKSQIKQLNPTEIIEALNILQQLKVPSSNLFIVTLLNQLKNSSTELSFQEINRLSILLTKFVPTDTIDEINIFMQNQFFSRFSSFKNHKISVLIDALDFASKNIKDYKTINVITNCIENCEEKFELNEALVILDSLCSIKNLPDNLTKTINGVKETINNSIHELQNHQVLQIIKNISFLINMNHEEFYDDTFIDELVQKIICENWSFIEGNNILQYLNSIRHVQMDLLDYLSAKLYEDQSKLILDADLLHPLVTGIALADYKPVFWDAIQEPIMNIETSKVSHLKLCHYVFDLACLECFEPRLLHEVFSLKNIMSVEHQDLLLKLYRIVKILYPEYNGPWPCSDVLESFKTIQKNENKNFPLLSALEQAVGGDAFILTNVKTSLEHYIDHVIIMNKNGYPIATNSYGTIESIRDITYIEDLRIPPGTQTYLILYAQPEWYARNTQRILGPYSLFIKTLETMSYTVISIDGKKWQEMSLNKKISYIMQAIQLRFEPDSISTTS